MIQNTLIMLSMYIVYILLRVIWTPTSKYRKYVVIKLIFYIYNKNVNVVVDVRTLPNPS